MSILILLNKDQFPVEGGFFISQLMTICIRFKCERSSFFLPSPDYFLNKVRICDNTVFSVLSNYTKWISIEYRLGLNLNLPDLFIKISV